MSRLRRTATRSQRVLVCPALISVQDSSHSIFCGDGFLVDEDPYGEKAAGIWSVYIRESKTYDKAMVENWKGDTDGILIFAGLFSAVITSLLVQSLQNTQPNFTQFSASVLQRISQQLDILGNTTVENSLPSLPSGQSYTDIAALRVNTLWSLSLCLNLVCALVATLVQQWARDYMQSIERPSTPLHRSRVRALLYHGIEVSGVKGVVDAIPVLLHCSLFLFIGGFYDFMAPTSLIIANIFASFLCVCGFAYLSASLVPMWNVGSPYRTPLSSALF
ncbi:hypothetical protein K488DRAFT_46618, partial [Vararia minispora EC-137]